jgi:2-oxoglutarate ferredoxin oxidoreductase subunit beta
VFRAVDRPAYDDAARAQVAQAQQARGQGDLAALLTSGDTWTVE